MSYPIYRIKEDTTCGICFKDKERGCWVKAYGRRVFVCPDCYRDLLLAKKMPYSALADNLAMSVVGYYANRKYARG